jgi:hypothetical protein
MLRETSGLAGHVGCTYRRGTRFIASRTNTPRPLPWFVTVVFSRSRLRAGEPADRHGRCDREHADQPDDADGADYTHDTDDTYYTDYTHDTC